MSEHHISNSIPESGDPARAPGNATAPGDKIVETKYLIMDGQITLNKRREQERKNFLPAHLFRMGYDYSATMSAYVGKENHRKNKVKPHAQLDKDNAYQNFGNFSITEDINKHRFHGHLRPNKTTDPSPYVSATSSRPFALKIGKARYHRRSPPSDRVHIAQISTKGLVAGTFRGRLRTTVNTYDDKEKLTTSDSVITYCDARIPVWVRLLALPTGVAKISIKQWEQSGADMWLSIKELTETPELDFRVADTHDTEWLSCGPIRKEHVVQVMPFDGDTAYADDGTKPLVRSKRNLGWIWSWELQRWVLDARLLPGQVAGTKRKLVEAEDETTEDDTSDDLNEDDLNEDDSSADDDERNQAEV